METLESPPARIIAPLFLGHCDLDKAPSPRQLALLHCSCKAAGRRHAASREDTKASTIRFHSRWASCIILCGPLGRTEASVLRSGWEWRFHSVLPAAPAGGRSIRSARGAAQHGGWRPLDFFRPFPQFDHLGNASIGYASAVCSFSRPSWIDDDVSR